MEYGIYEQVINIALAKNLAGLSEKQKFISPIDTAESAKVLAKYLTDILENGLKNIRDNGQDADAQISFVNKIIELVSNLTGESLFRDFKIENFSQLLGVLDKLDPKFLAGKAAKDFPRPESSIAMSSLFTGAPHEPQISTELQKEIMTADRIDILVAFIRWSGLRLLINQLKEFTRKGGKLRIITTTYTGATDIKAIDELGALVNTILKINYDTSNTRLHAKAYIFHRNTNFSTAYIGSSNISHAALTNGLEWNTKITRTDLPETMEKIEATFESYWNNPDFLTYTNDNRELLLKRLNAEKHCSGNSLSGYVMDIKPYIFQKEILDKLDAERSIHGFNHNLVVAATGTGKTAISAFDYQRYRLQNPQNRARLLFVAHREEILKQSISTFRAVLKDANFGELCVGKFSPESLENLFISIQSVLSQNFTEKIPRDYYDYIVVDEFHHAAAKSYRKLLEHFKPKILLGLTATPERMDGQNILHHFDNRIAAEIRLPEAINRNLLSSFQYFCIDDNIDLSAIKWSAGGYDKNELSKIYSLSGEMAKQRAELVRKAIIKYVTDINDVKCIGFCVSVEHAQFMSEHFNQKNLPSRVLTSSSSSGERNIIKHLLETGEIKFIFVVDLYNEGVDIPAINTILFLRPTESLTIFLQQLGRGLRLYKDKECLTVLDFIGQAHKKYNFLNKFSALLSSSHKGIAHEIKKGFVSLPKGCSIQMEKMAAQYILDNIKTYFNNTNYLINQMQSFSESSGNELNLKNFLDYYRLDCKQLYKSQTFSRLCVKAGLTNDFNEPFEEIAIKAFQRISNIDSRRWINFILQFLNHLSNPDFHNFIPLQKRMLQMFYVTVFGKTTDNFLSIEAQNNFSKIANSPKILAELNELLQYRKVRIDFVDVPIDLGFACPLDLHCSYSRDQILIAMDYMNPANIREGVKWIKEKNIDLLFITLNKSDKEYSPTTLYDDYSINENLFHWQSQSTTSESSKTGQRYINHAKLKNKILLFVREYKIDFSTGLASPYTFLGTAKYLKHTGSRPMNIIWKLDYPIPAKFLKKTQKLIAC